MTITECQAIALSRLQSRISLRGVTLVSVDSHDIDNEVSRALAKLGVAGIVGTTDGTNPELNHRAPNFTTTLGVLISENVVINRGRTLAATVADESARLALTDVDPGQKVLQSDTGKYWWLKESPESTEANWAPLLTATEILELVIRTLHFYSPTRSETFVATGYAFQENESETEVLATFQIRTYLDPTLPE